MNYLYDPILSEFQERCKIKKEFRIKEEIVENQKFYIASYMIINDKSFQDNLDLEFRGITFDENGQCVSRPFHKFFNVEENIFSDIDKINWDNAIFSYKYDGSMLIPVLINDKIYWKTKKSFYSDIAKTVQDKWDFYIKDKLHANLYHFCEMSEYLIKEWLKSGYTPVFEYISPKNRIVINYKENFLKLLAIRNNKTGNYIFLLSEYENKKINLKSNSSEMIINYVKGLENIEGFVIYDGNNLYKLKTDWYLKRHHIITEITLKNVIDNVYNGTIDDYISNIRQLKEKELADKIQNISNYIFRFLIEEVDFLESLYEKYKHIENRKDFVLEIQKNDKNYLPALIAIKDRKFDILDNIVKKLNRDKIFSILEKEF